MSATPRSASVHSNAVMQSVTDRRVAGMAMGDMRLAVGEAINNAVVHAYVGQTYGLCHRHGRSGGPRVFRPGLRSRERDGPLHDSPGLGLGLPLMLKLASSVDVRAPISGPGTELTMVFRADHSAASKPVQRFL